MIGHGDVKFTLTQTNVRAILPGDGEAEATQRFDGFGAGDVAREFHAVATTGSWRKCRRMVRGVLPLPK